MLADEDAIRYLKHDLAAFADPGSLISLAASDNGYLRAMWLEDTVQRSADFAFDDGRPSRVRRVNGITESYRAFLAGSDMGNLRSLARNILQVIDPLRVFVTPRGRLEGNAPEDGNAVDLLVSAARPNSDLTSVVFVAADAGVGKTILLRQAVRLQAERYLSGETTSMWLYVDAQARRLAALDEALAGELDRLRAKFSFDAAVPLVRSGAVTLVIDGFDELIGSVGAYDEAFSGLADFISELEGGGSLVAAARSAYYEQEFLSRVGRGLGRGDRWTLLPLRLREWRRRERRDFVVSQARESGVHSRSDELVEQLEAALSSSDLSGVAGKPFFVARTTQLVIDQSLPRADSAHGLLDRLVDAYVARDVSKLLSASREPLLGKAGLRLFFDELAIEMWRQESRELTRSTVRELATLLGEMEGVDEDGVREIALRAPYFAMLREGSMPGSVAWEHDVFFAYFLSQPLANAMGDREARKLARLLRRGRLPEDAAFMSSRLSGIEETQPFLDLLAQAVTSEELDVDRVRRNAGLIVAGRLADGVHEGLRVHDVTIGDVALGSAVLEECSFRNVGFAGTDLSSTRFVKCHVESNVSFDRVLVSPERTQLEINNLSPQAFFGLSIRDDEDVRTLFSPADVRATLRQCALPSATSPVPVRSVDPEVLNLLLKLIRTFTRTNIVVEGSDNDLVPLTSDASWSLVRRALIDSGTVVAQTKSASGRKTFLERTVGAAEIMAGLDPSAEVPDVVSEFWRLIEN